MADISSQYSNLFGSRVKPPQANIAPPAPSPTFPNAANTYVPAPNRPDASIAVPAAPTDVRAELVKLRAELADINKQIDALIAKVDAQPPAAPPPLPPMPQIPPAGPTGPVVGPAQAGPTPGGGQMTVAPGDYLWKIAKERLGDANRWPEIYELNKAAIGPNPNLLMPGQVLQLPGAGPGVQPAVAPPSNNIPPLPQYPPVGPAQPPAGPPSLPPLPQYPPAGPVQPVPPPLQPVQPQGVTDTPAMPPSARQMSDADVTRLAGEFGLVPPNQPMTPAMRANVLTFLDEMDSYETTQKGKVFGPGMEALATNPTEGAQIKQAVQQIQMALDMLIKGGKLKPVDAQGRPVAAVVPSGSFFQVDAQGKEVKDAQGNPLMDNNFIAAITQFKMDQGIHQHYRLADGTFAINEYVGPSTIEALKTALTAMQARR